MVRGRARCIALAGLIGGLVAGPVSAQVDVFSPDVVSVYADFRTSITTGEASWTQLGAGKTRFGTGRSDAAFDLAEAGLVWRPRLGWALSGYAHLQYDEAQDNVVGLTEAFLRYRPVPRSAWRWSGRAGVFYPPISLEHEEDAWAVKSTLSPSAINSWIGEEVKGVGVEIGAEREFGSHAVALTGGVFGFNDTTGVLISYRGWALHDIKTALSSAYPVRFIPVMTVSRDRLTRQMAGRDITCGSTGRPRRESISMWSGGITRPIQTAGTGIIGPGKRGSSISVPRSRLMTGIGSWLRL